MIHTCTYEFDPTNHESTSVTTSWSCPHPAHEDRERCLFHLSAADREQIDISSATVTEQITDILKNAVPEKRVFIGASLDTVDLDYRDIEGVDQHRIDFRHATIDEFTAERARFEEQIDLRHSTVGRLQLNNADLEEGLLCTEITVQGKTNLFEAVITGDNTDFEGAVFEDDVTIDEAEFSNDVCFADATFSQTASFRGTQLYGTSNSIGDNTTFDGAVFEGPAVFYHTNFEYTSFRSCTFNDEAVFEKATADGSVLFPDVMFGESVDFDEVSFSGDVSFENAVFECDATFVGVEFNGGAAILEDDVSFAGAVFESDVSFRRGAFRYSNFTDATFEGELVMQRTRFNDDCSFENADCYGVVDFDEAQFNGDANFTDVVFHADAIFRGAEFHGGTNYLADDAIFTGATFAKNVDFRDALFTSANFMETAFKRDVNFTAATFTDELHLKATSFGDDTYINFTRATIPDGTITQPTDGWVRFDLTDATIGTVSLEASTPTDKRELLDYFRFCDTSFQEFDFSKHTEYLDRNDWNLHGFDGGTAHYEFERELTPPMIEKTYLKAKQNASAQSDIKAAGEFRVKRQQAARDKFAAIASDRTESVRTRFKNGLRAVENLFLGVSCGYGLRLYRITAVFILFPLFSGFLFAFGGDSFETGAGQLPLVEALTVEGLNTVAMNLYFSYITFLTIGYGNIGPIGLGARFIAAALVYSNVILAGLFLYALIKRSEV